MNLFKKITNDLPWRLVTQFYHRRTISSIGVGYDGLRQISII